MLKINYIGETETYLVSFESKSTTNNIVQVVGEFPIKTSGFILSRVDADDNWDYSLYTTVYREIDGGAQFSNDGSVYIEPEPYVPTLEDIKNEKKDEIISTYDGVMIQGTSVALSDKSIVNISITQDFINTTNTAYLSAMTLYGQEGVLIPFEIDNVCYSYSPIDVLLIYIAEQQFIVYNKSLKNELLATIDRKEIKEDVEFVTYSLDCLDEKALTDFQTSMANGSATIEAIINKYGIMV